MGQVYRARDTRLQRAVALKVLPDAFAADPDRATRFDREAHVPIAFKSDFRMAFYPPSAGSIRRGKMALPLTSADSWNWYVGVDRGRPHHRVQHEHESRALEIQ